MVVDIELEIVEALEEVVFKGPELNHCRDWALTSSAVGFFVFFLFLLVLVVPSHKRRYSQVRSIMVWTSTSFSEVASLSSSLLAMVALSLSGQYQCQVESLWLYGCGSPRRSSPGYWKCSGSSRQGRVGEDSRHLRRKPNVLS